MQINPLPITKTEAPQAVEDLLDIVRESISSRIPIYPIGGGTALDYGLPPKMPGIGLSLVGLADVIDYPARDMTVTVQAGIRIAELQKLLASQRQRLPIDAPQADTATLGGVIATNTSGPRRYGNGTLRDYVIGISAVDGHGTAFKSGGRVVKNVAGYDFCRLLVGSLGTLAVITQVTLKVKPLPERSAFVVSPIRDLGHAELVIDVLSKSRTSPAAIEILAGPGWRNGSVFNELRPGESGFVLVGVEGTDPEVHWMVETLIDELSTLESTSPCEISATDIMDLWRRLTEFPAQAGSPLVLKVSVPPSRVAAMLTLIIEADPVCSIQAHAGNGIIIAQFGEYSSTAISKILVGSLQPAAQRLGGHVTVLRAENAGELTHQATWGSLGDSAMLMAAIKHQFDPHGLLNPGRI